MVEDNTGKMFTTSYPMKSHHRSHGLISNISVDNAEKLKNVPKIMYIYIIDDIKLYPF